MNFLALVQRTIRECGATGSTLLTVSGVSGEAQRFVDWVSEAWNEIQTKHDDWEWLRSSVLLGEGASFPTVSGTVSYPVGVGAGKVGIDPATFGKWDRESFRSNTTAMSFNDEIRLGYIPYDGWRDAYMIGAQRSVTTRPEVVSIGPDKSVCLGPPPTSLYTITGDYFLAPSAMAADADTPTGLPAQFHLRAIVGLAMIYYGGYEAAPEVLSRGQGWYSTAMGQIEGLQAQEIMMGGPLA